MPQSTPRAVLLGHLLRQSDLGRAARLLDRLDDAALTACIEQLDPGELSVFAELALAHDRVQRTARLSLCALVALVDAARDADVRRLLGRLPAGPATRILLGLDRGRRQHIGRLLVEHALPTSRPPVPSPPRADRLGAAFRQRRLFSAG